MQQKRNMHQLEIKIGAVYTQNTIIQGMLHIHQA